MLVRLTQNTTLSGRSVASLTKGQVYVVIGIEADDYRILNDHSDPCLYDPTCFEVTDSTEPEFWQCEVGAEGERYCYPQEFCQSGFFEDYHDGIPQAVRQFHAVYQRLYASTRSSEV